MKPNLVAIAMAANIVERTILCSDGIKIAAKHWKSKSPSATGRKLICTHGWLDNAASFDIIAPILCDKGHVSEIIALDFPGHGLSSHKSPDGPPQVLAEFVFYVAEVATQLEWNKFSLIGHSMGAAVSVIYAAAFPEKMESLVLLEGAGPLTREAKDFSVHIRKACEKRLRSNKTLYSNPSVSDPHLKLARVYPNIETAISTRMNTAKLSPGRQYISTEAARVLVERATIPSSAGGETVIFRHDPRLQWPSLQYATTEQLEGIWENVQCPTCFLQAEDGWPYEQQSLERLKEILKPIAHEILPGSHHFHADPDTAGGVVEKIDDFFSSLL